MLLLRVDMYLIILMILATIENNNNFDVFLGFKNYKQSLIKAINIDFKSKNEQNDIKNYINFEIGKHK